MTPDLERLNELYEKAPQLRWTFTDCGSDRTDYWQVSASEGQTVCTFAQMVTEAVESTRAAAELITALHNAWPALYAQLRAAAPNRPIAQEAQQGPYHPSIAEQEVLRRALLASVKVIHPGVTTGEPPHAQAATAVSGDAAAHAVREARRDALEEAAKVCEAHKGGFTVSVVDGMLIRDPDGPWTCGGGDIAAKIRALRDAPMESAEEGNG